MQEQYFQQPLPLNFPPEDKSPIEEAEVIRNNNNSISPVDRVDHDWYRFVLSFPPHLVRDYINDFKLDERSLILDPFCGTGTTLVEAKLHGIEAIGLEANPFPHFASMVKTDWNIDPNDFVDFARQVSEKTYADLVEQGIDDRALTSESTIELKTLEEQAMKAMIKNSISPLPLHKTLTLLEQINCFQNTPFYKHSILALGNALIQSIGNLRFGPEVGVGKIKRDVPVVALWMQEIKKYLLTYS